MANTRGKNKITSLEYDEIKNKIEKYESLSLKLKANNNFVKAIKIYREIDMNKKWMDLINQMYFEESEIRKEMEEL